MKPAQGGERGPWRWLWLAWLVAFLATEIPAALRERGASVRTLSRHVWRYFRGWRRAPLAAFLVVLSAHFLVGSAHWWSSAAAVCVTGAPVLLLFAAGVVRD